MPNLSLAQSLISTSDRGPTPTSSSSAPSSTPRGDFNSEVENARRTEAQRQSPGPERSQARERPVPENAKETRPSTEADPKETALAEQDVGDEPSDQALLHNEQINTRSVVIPDLRPGWRDPIMPQRSMRPGELGDTSTRPRYETRPEPTGSLDTALGQDGPARTGRVAESEMMISKPSADLSKMTPSLSVQGGAIHTDETLIDQPLRPYKADDPTAAAGSKPVAAATPELMAKGASSTQSAAVPTEVDAPRQPRHAEQLAGSVTANQSKPITGTSSAPVMSTIASLAPAPVDESYQPRIRKRLEADPLTNTRDVGRDLKQVPTPKTAATAVPLAPTVTFAEAVATQSQADLVLAQDADLETMQFESRSSTTAPTNSTFGTVLARGEIPRSVALQIQDVARTLSDRPVDVSLSPEELGKVRLSISASEGGVVLNVLAERPETLDMMRRHAEVLARELGDLGFTSIDLAFGQGGSADADSDNDGTWSGDDSAPGQDPVGAGLAETEQAQSLHLNLDPDDGLDIRL